MLLPKWLIGYIILFFSACQVSDTLYAHTYPLGGHVWHRQETLQFNFYVSDTTHSYTIYLLVKNTPTYPYQNLYVTYYLKDSQSTVIATKLTNHLLFEPTTGRPLGKGWGKHKNHEIIILPDHYFTYPGHYTLELAQFMRTEALSGLCTVGIKICKSPPSISQLR